MHKLPNNEDVFKDSEVASWKGLTVGKRCQITLTVDVDVWEAIKELSGALGLHRSRLVEHAILQFMDNWERAGRPRVTALAKGEAPCTAMTHPMNTNGQ